MCNAERMLIGGELVESVGGDWQTSINPATEVPIGRVPAGTAGDVERAVVAAEAAWPAWAERTPMQRAETMNRFADAIAARADEILQVEVSDTEYGLTASIWTNDIKGALRMAHKVRSGHIWVNASSAHYLGVPFGGMKSSGVGREEGREELYSYTETKTINILL